VEIGFGRFLGGDWVWWVFGWRLGLVGFWVEIEFGGFLGGDWVFGLGRLFCE